MIPQKRLARPIFKENANKKPRIASSSPNVVTRGAKRRSLADAVFLTTELLENVLRQLPMKDLLLAQRVCKKWKAVILGSQNLQKALYFLPREPQLKWKYQPKPIRSLTKVSLDPPLTPPHEYGAPRVTSVYPIGTFNPLLSDQGRPVQTLMQLAHERWDSIMMRSLPSMKYPEASWRSMLLTQPSITVGVAGCCYGSNDQNGIVHEVELYNANGITAWDLVNTCPDTDVWGQQISWQNTSVVIDDMLLVSDVEWRMSNEELKAMANKTTPWWPLR